MQSSAPSHNHNHHAEPLPYTPASVQQDVLGFTVRTGAAYRVVQIILALLLGAGIVGFILKVQAGFADRAHWGYYIAVFAYLVTTTQAAPLVSIGLRMAKGHWRRPFARVAELYAFVGIFSFILFLPLLAVMPPVATSVEPFVGRRSLWMDWPGSPHIWDLIAMVVLFFGGLGLLLIAAMPDLAAAGRTADGPRGFFVRLARGFVGGHRQWWAHQRALSVAGGLYFIFFIFTQSFILIDLSLSFVPGWVDPIAPAFYSLTALQSGLALTIVTMFLMRNLAGFKEYFTLDQFWGAAKLLLSLSLLWFYFWWSGFIIFWYGRQPNEQNLIELLMFGPYRYAFYTAITCNFILPLLLLMWNPVRKSILGPTVVGVLILIGSFFNSIRLFVGPHTIPDPTAEFLDFVPVTRLPDLSDWLVIVGGLAGAGLFYLIALKAIPPISIWEIKELISLRIVRPLLQTVVAVVGKPE